MWSFHGMSCRLAVTPVPEVNRAPQRGSDHATIDVARFFGCSSRGDHGARSISRHIFRESPAVFTCESPALVLAREAVRAGADRAVDDEHRKYFCNEKPDRIYSTGVFPWDRCSVKFSVNWRPLLIRVTIRIRSGMDVSEWIRSA